MAVTTMDINSLRGTVLALDSRRRDALATFARLSAEDDGVPAQTWVRTRWGLKDYEAKSLLRGDATEPVWERILKHKNGGWSVALPVMGAVIGHGLGDFITKEKARHERARKDLERREQRLVETARDLPAVFGVGPDRDRRLPDRRARAGRPPCR